MCWMAPKMLNALQNWLKDFNDKILQPINMHRKQSQVKNNANSYENLDIWDSIADSFIKLTDGVVQTAVKATLASIDPATATIRVGDVSMFKHI